MFCLLLKEVLGMSNQNEDSKIKNSWFHDFIKSRMDKMQLCLDEIICSELKEKLWSDQLIKKDVLMIIQALFENSQNLWSSEEIFQAWGKSRSMKNNKHSDSNRTKGNEKVKSGQFSVALTYYNEAVVWAENESQQFSMALANRALPTHTYFRNLEFYLFESNIQILMYGFTYKRFAI